MGHHLQFSWQHTIRARKCCFFLNPNCRCWSIFFCSPPTFTNQIVIQLGMSAANGWETSVNEETDSVDVNQCLIYIFSGGCHVLGTKRAMGIKTKHVFRDQQTQWLQLGSVPRDHVFFCSFKRTDTVCREGTSVCLKKKTWRPQTTWVEGVWSFFWILEPNIIVLFIQLLQVPFSNTSNTPKNLVNFRTKKHLKKQTPIQKKTKYTPKKLEKWVGLKSPYTKGSTPISFPLRFFPGPSGPPLLPRHRGQKWGFHLVLHDGRTSKPWRVTWGVGFWTGETRWIPAEITKKNHPFWMVLKNPCKKMGYWTESNWWFLPSIEVLGGFYWIFLWSFFAGEKDALPKLTTTKKCLGKLNDVNFRTVNNGHALFFTSIIPHPVSFWPEDVKGINEIWIKHGTFHQSLGGTFCQ